MSNIFSGLSSLLNGVSNLSGSVSNVKTSGWDTFSGFTSGLGSVNKVLNDVNGIVTDVNRMSSGDGYDEAFKMLDQSPLWYTVAQNAQIGATQTAAQQYMTAGYSEQDLNNYNALISEVEAQIIERNGQLAIFQQAREDKVLSAARENSANASGFYTAESPVRALLRHEDAVAEYGRSLMSYQTSVQAQSKRQEGEMQRYKGSMALYLASRQSDATKMSAYYRMLSSSAEINAQKAARSAELSAYGENKRSINQPFTDTRINTGVDTNKAGWADRQENQGLIQQSQVIDYKAEYSGNRDSYLRGR